MIKFSNVTDYAFVLWARLALFIPQTVSVSASRVDVKCEDDKSSNIVEMF